jgi:hypothetical protein
LYEQRRSSSAVGGALEMTQHTIFMLHKIAGMAVRRHCPLAGAQQQQQQRHKQGPPVVKPAFSAWLQH